MHTHNKALPWSSEIAVSLQLIAAHGGNLGLDPLEINYTLCTAIAR